MSKEDPYSFCMFRIPEDGGRVLWEITRRCNYSCPYCISTSGPDCTDEELSTGEVRDTMFALKDRGFSHIKFTGGEPFFRDDFLEILRLTSDLKFKVDVSTNASLLSKEVVAQLKEFDLDLVHVSLDGDSKETHEGARGVNTYLPTVSGIKNLVAGGIYTRIGSLIYKGNDSRLEETVLRACELGVDELIFSYMAPVGRIEGDNSLISNRGVVEVGIQLNYLAEKYASLVKVKYSFGQSSPADEGVSCPALTKFLYINNKGNVLPCTWAEASSSNYSSDMTLKNNSLDEILQSNPMRRFSKMILEYNESGKTGCPVR